MDTIQGNNMFDTTYDDKHLIWTTPEGVELWLGAEPVTYYKLDMDLIINCNGYWPADHIGFIGEANFNATCPILMFPFRDSGDEMILPGKTQFDGFLDGTHQFIATAEPKRVLFHCHAGINRSSFMLAQYLCRYWGFTPEDAVKLIREKRSHWCLDNGLFFNRLHEWYRARP